MSNADADAIVFGEGGAESLWGPGVASSVSALLAAFQGRHGTVGERGTRCSEVPLLIAAVGLGIESGSTGGLVESWDAAFEASEGVHEMSTSRLQRVASHLDRLSRQLEVHMRDLALVGSEEADVRRRIAETHGRPWRWNDAPPRDTPPLPYDSVPDRDEIAPSFIWSPGSLQTAATAGTASGGREEHPGASEHAARKDSASLSEGAADHAGGGGKQGECPSSGGDRRGRKADSAALSWWHHEVHHDPRRRPDKILRAGGARGLPESAIPASTAALLFTPRGNDNVISAAWRHLHAACADGVVVCAILVCLMTTDQGSSCVLAKLAPSFPAEKRPCVHNASATAMRKAATNMLYGVVSDMNTVNISNLTKRGSVVEHVMHWREQTVCYFLHAMDKGRIPDQW